MTLVDKPEVGGADPDMRFLDESRARGPDRGCTRRRAGRALSAPCT